MTESIVLPRVVGEMWVFWGGEGEGHKGGGQIWKYWEISVIGVQDVKLPKNQ